MSFKATSFLTRSLVVSVVIVSAGFLGGCGEDTSTGTSVQKPPGAEEAEKKSMDFMKAHMKEFSNPLRKGPR